MRGELNETDRRNSADAGVWCGGVWQRRGCADHDSCAGHGDRRDGVHGAGHVEFVEHDDDNHVPAPPTTSIEDLEAQIAADYERAFFLRYELLAAPSLDNLEANVAEIAVTGSPAFEPIVKGIRDLVAAGDRVVPNDPDILTVTIENVELVGDAPYSEAIVTACMVSNRKQVTPAENSPVSSQIDVVGSGDLAAIRIPDPVRLTDGRWLRYATRVTAQEYQGQDTCPAP